MHSFLIDFLQCPACHSPLDWVIKERAGDRIETAEARCTGCGVVYPVRAGVAGFLTPDLPREDLWATVDSNLAEFLRDNPDIEKQLLEAPLETLNPADRVYRAYILDERGDFAGSEAARQGTDEGLYTPEYLACQASQVAYLLDHLSGGSGPIVDLASGRGYLVEKIAKSCSRPVVATDFSPSILLHNRRLYEHLGFYDRVSLLAFDARRTPFKDGAVQTMTTFLGLPNITDPGPILDELRRVVSGEFLAIHFFFPEDDQPNLREIRIQGLDHLLIKPTALYNFRKAGWTLKTANTCASVARPTPPCSILEGARVDGMPVADTILEWCTLVGK